MSLMEEISDLEDDYENPFECTSKREKIKKFVENVKFKSKRGYFNLRRSMSNIGRRMRMRMTSAKSAGADKVGDDGNASQKSTLGFTSSRRSTKKSKTLLSLSKLRLISRRRMISTSRKARMHRKVSRASNRATYKLKTNFSYVSKRVVSASSAVKSRIVYNCYKFCNLIGDRFPKRGSMFVLSFRKGSEETERKTMNCGHNLSNELNGFENDMVYDSVEYMSRNGDGNVIEEFEPEKKVDGDKVEIGLIKSELSMLESNNESDEITPTTTIDSFLRLSSIDSTCTTIQNDTNSNAPFPVMLSMEKAMEQMESLYQELLIRLGNCTNNREISDNNDKKPTNPFSFEKEDMEIFSIVREMVDDLNKEERVDNDLNNNGDNALKQCQPRNDLVLSLLRQAIQYYENIKLSHSELELKKEKYTDNAQIKHQILNAVQKLKSGGNVHAL